MNALDRWGDAHQVAFMLFVFVPLVAIVLVDALRKGRDRGGR